jgi:hypothetical protein
MNHQRRLIAASLAAAPFGLFGTDLFAQTSATTLKISHQFPGGTIDQGDFRDRLCRRFAAESKGNGVNSLILINCLS